MAHVGGPGGMGAVVSRGIWKHRGVKWATGLSATRRAVLLAGVVGLVVLFVAWLVGPSLFAPADEPERVVAATVTESAPCTKADARETVSFTDGGRKQSAQLPACGHDKGEKLMVAVPEDPGEGALTVRVADTDVGVSKTRQNIGLLLMALACVGGGLYAWIVTRKTQRSAVRAA